MPYLWYENVKNVYCLVLLFEDMPLCLWRLSETTDFLFVPLQLQCSAPECFAENPNLSLIWLPPGINYSQVLFVKFRIRSFVIFLLEVEYLEFETFRTIQEWGQKSTVKLGYNEYTVITKKMSCLVCFSMFYQKNFMGITNEFS